MDGNEGALNRKKSHPTRNSQSDSPLNLHPATLQKLPVYRSKTPGKIQFYTLDCQSTEIKLPEKFSSIR